MNKGLVGNRVFDGVVKVTVESGMRAYTWKDMKPKFLEDYAKTVSRTPERMSGAGRNCAELRVESIDEKHSEVMDWKRDGKVRTWGVWDTKKA